MKTKTIKWEDVEWKDKKDISDEEIFFPYRKVNLSISFNLTQSGMGSDKTYSNKTYSSPYYTAVYNMVAIKDLKYHNFSEDKKLFKELLVEKLVDEIISKLREEEIIALLEPLFQDKKKYEVF